MYPLISVVHVVNPSVLCSSLFYYRELNIVSRHHDAVSLWELLCSGVFPLLYNIQVQRAVSVLNQNILNMCGEWRMTVYAVLCPSVQSCNYRYMFFYILLFCGKRLKSLLIICLVMSEVWEGVCLILLQLLSVLVNLVVLPHSNTIHNCCHILKHCIQNFQFLPGLTSFIVTRHIRHSVRAYTNITVQNFNSMCPIFSSEYNAFWRCVQAGATYLFVQLCKVSELSGNTLIRHHFGAKVPRIKYEMKNK